jgi:hypothetical protein
MGMYKRPGDRVLINALGDIRVRPTIFEVNLHSSKNYFSCSFSMALFVFERPVCLRSHQSDLAVMWLRHPLFVLVFSAFSRVHVRTMKFCHRSLPACDAGLQDPVL